MLTSCAVTLQVSYLLSLALLVVTYLPSFPPAPRSMFRVLGKLDLAFASLIQGREVDTGEPLPISYSGRGITGTEKVRIKSLIQSTRVAVVELMARDEAHEREYDDGMASQTDDMEMETDETMDTQEMLGLYDMDVARVYDRTLVELGDSLGGPMIGVQD